MQSVVYSRWKWFWMVLTSFLTSQNSLNRSENMSLWTTNNNNINVRITRRPLQVGLNITERCKKWTVPAAYIYLLWNKGAQHNTKCVARSAAPAYRLLIIMKIIVHQNQWSSRSLQITGANLLLYDTYSRSIRVFFVIFVANKVTKKQVHSAYTIRFQRVGVQEAQESSMTHFNLIFRLDAGQRVKCSIRYEVTQ